MQRSRDHDHIVDLIAARERAAVKKDHPRWISRQKIARGLQHQLQTEIILASGVFDFVRGEERMTEFVFAQDSA